MNQTTKDVLEAIAGLEKVADELSPANGQVIAVKAKYDTKSGLIGGNTYEVINHSGHYYWLMCGGRWIDKDLFRF